MVKRAAGKGGAWKVLKPPKPTAQAARGAWYMGKGRRKAKSGKIKIGSGGEARRRKRRGTAKARKRSKSPAKGVQ